MLGKYRLEDMERPALALATLAATAVAVAALVGVHGDPGGWPAAILISVAALGSGAAFVSRRRVTGAVSFAALMVTAVSGRWIHEGVSEGLMLGMTLTWSVLAVLFSRRRTLELASAAVIVSFAGPMWWHGLPGLPEAFGHALIASVVVGLVVVARSQLLYATQAFVAVFDHAPIGIMEQNWSETLAELERLRRSGVSDLGTYLRENPSEAGRLFATARVVSRNAEAARVLLTPAVDGHHRPETVDDTLFEGVVALLEDFFQGRLVRRVVFPMPDDEGKVHWHHVTSFPHPAGNGDFIVVTADITAVKEAEEALERLVASKDRFVASISHELRTPLAAVVGFTGELLERPDAASADEREEFLRLAHEQAIEAANIIADLLVVARADIGGVTVTHGAVDMASEIRHVLASHDWEVDVVGDERLPEVCGDPGRVRQILRNLLTNAVRYGGPSERIVCSSTERAVSVEVRDDGPEMDQASLDALFEPYARAHESFGITESVGLGLTVARHLAVLMGGSLVAFRDGGETVFRLTLPVLDRCLRHELEPSQSRRVH